MAKVNSYQAGKESARQKAKDFQADVENMDLSWWDVAHMGEYFEKLGKRYGLLGEFRENGII